MSKWRQRYHGIMAVYHMRRLQRHCAHLPAWFLQDTLGMEPIS